MARPLDIYTLNNAARHYAEEFAKPSRPGVNGKYVAGRQYVLQNMEALHFKDEFEVIEEILLDALSDSDRKLFQLNFDGAPRTDDELEFQLRERLAIDMDGNHIEGVIGKVEIGKRRVGTRVVEHEIRRKVSGWKKMLGLKGELLEKRFIPRPDYWPVYAGELAERLADTGVADPLPEGSEAFVNSHLATNPRISNVAAILACDAIVDALDVGSTAAEIRGRTGTQPAGVDATETGTLLFTLPMSDPAFGAAADASPGATATADTITDDSSADATGTLGYCRVAATGSGADDVLDGEAGTSGADFNFSTLAIVSGATISMSSFTVTVPEG